jgi:membrane-bound lytic murein transglycosylase
MALADPKNYAVVKDDNDALRAQVALLTEQMQALAARAAQPAGGITADQFESMMLRITAAQADAHKQAALEISERERKEDLSFPRKSVFSYPEGDTKRPRQAFKCKMFWLGFDQDHDVTTAYEIECLNQFEPGSYTFHRIGGQPEVLTVDGDREPSGKLRSLKFMFPTKENRDTLPSMIQILRDALGLKTPEQIELDKLRAELAAMKAQA